MQVLLVVGTFVFFLVSFGRMGRTYGYGFHPRFLVFVREPTQNGGSGPTSGPKWIRHPKNGGGGDIVDTPDHLAVG